MADPQTPSLHSPGAGAPPPPNTYWPYSGNASDRPADAAKDATPIQVAPGIFYWVPPSDAQAFAAQLHLGRTGTQTAGLDPISQALAGLGMKNVPNTAAKQVFDTTSGMAATGGDVLGTLIAARLGMEGPALELAGMTGNSIGSLGHSAYAGDSTRQGLETWLDNLTGHAIGSLGGRAGEAVFDRGAQAAMARSLNPSDEVIKDVSIPGQPNASDAAKRQYLAQKALDEGSFLSVPGQKSFTKKSTDALADVRNQYVNAAQTAVAHGAPPTVPFEPLVDQTQQSLKDTLNASDFYSPASQAFRTKVQRLVDTDAFGHNEPIFPFTNQQPGLVSGNTIQMPTGKPSYVRAPNEQVDLTDLAKNLTFNNKVTDYGTGVEGTAANLANKQWGNTVREAVRSGVDPWLPAGSRSSADMANEMQWRIPFDQAAQEAELTAGRASPISAPEAASLAAGAVLGDMTKLPYAIPVGATMFLRRPTNLGRIAQALTFANDSGATRAAGLGLGIPAVSFASSAAAGDQ